MDNNKITNHQVYTMASTMSLGGSILVVGSTIAGVAKQDAWISPVISIILGLFVMLIYYYLGSRYPGMTLIGIIQSILGKWLGSVISIMYVFLFFTVSSHIPWYISSFVGRWMHETPAYFISIIFIAVIVIAVLYGIEAIARASELFYLFVTVFFIAFIILIAKNTKIEYITPVLERGLSPVLKGSFFLSCFITFSAINMLTIFPRYVEDITQAKKALLKSQLWTGAISFLTILLSILVLGYTMTSKSSFPTLLLAAEIRLGAFLTRMEYITSIIWLVTEFMIGIFFFLSAITSLSEVLRLNDHKRIVLPAGLVVLVMSGVVYPSSVYQANWVVTVYPPLITTFGFIIPFLMVVVHAIKKRFFHAQLDA